MVGYFLDGETSADLAARLGVTESRVSQLRTEALKLMRAGIQAQYVEQPAVENDDPGRAAYRQAVYAAQLAARSTYATRLSRLPRQRASTEDLVDVRVAS